MPSIDRSSTRAWIVEYEHRFIVDQVGRSVDISRYGGWGHGLHRLKRVDDIDESQQVWVLCGGQGDE